MGEFGSAVFPPMNTEGFYLRYYLGNRTAPLESFLRLGYGICVFRTLEDAKTFRSSGQSIVRGRCGKVWRPKVWKSEEPSLEMLDPTRKGKWPKGTLMTTWFEPKEVVVE